MCLISSSPFPKPPPPWYWLGSPHTAGRMPKAAEAQMAFPALSPRRREVPALCVQSKCVGRLVLMTVLYLRNGQGGGQPYLARAGHMLTLQQDDGWARAEGVGATRTRKTQRDCIWSAVVSIIFPFYKLGNGGLERLGDSPGLESQMGFKPMSVSSTQSITRPSLRVILSPN